MGKINRIICADNLQVFKRMKSNFFDAIITDPPYGIGFMNKEWDVFDKEQFGMAGNEGEKDLKVKKNFKVLPRYNKNIKASKNLYKFTLKWATECLRIAKPGAFLLCFGGTRTYHRITSAIEDAGWEIRDCIMWVYGSGFPKSYNISKGFDKKEGLHKPILQPTRKGNKKFDRNTTYATDTHCGFRDISNNQGQTGKLWNGYGTTLKPAWEPIIVAMKPLDGSFLSNAIKHGVAGLNIGKTRINTKEEIGRDNTGMKKGVLDSSNGWNKNSMIGLNSIGKVKGRWPANLIHDGSDEITKLFPNFGHAARFFYCAKASKSERDKGLNGNSNPNKTRMRNNHPTVKPLSLMQYLIRLVKPPTEGIVLDPFCGSGTTCVAAIKEGMKFVGIEQDKNYCEIARRRIEFTKGQSGFGLK